MKLCCMLLFSFLQFSAIGQITYTPVLVDQCLGREVHDSWGITDSSGNNYEIDYFNSSSFDLPQTGKYWLESHYDMEDPIEIEIKSNNQVDTFYSVNLEIPLIISNPPPTRYRLCDQIAEGYCTDYYEKGKLRRVGTFKNGHPIDTVKTYYYTGELRELDIPIPQREKRVYFYKNGNIKREYGSQKPQDLEYFSNGQLARVWVYKKRGRSTEKEYYEKGQLKRSRKKGKEERYGQDGSKTDVLKRSITYGYFNHGFRLYKFRWKKYDSNGKVESKITFVRNNSDYPAYPHELSEVDNNDVKQVVLFEQGKPTQKIVVDKMFIERKFVYKTTIFKKEDGKWIEQRKGLLVELKQFL